MSRITFNYLMFDSKDSTGKVTGCTMRPYIPIRLSSHHCNPTHPIDALVDSGSDRNLFPKQLGNILGINFKKKKPTKIFGIGGVEILAYSSDINIWINGIKYITETDFSDQQQTPLLGRLGFFNLFKEVIFDEKIGSLYLEL